LGGLGGGGILTGKGGVKRGEKSSGWGIKSANKKSFRYGVSVVGCPTTFQKKGTRRGVGPYQGGGVVPI